MPLERGFRTFRSCVLRGFACLY